MNYAYLKEIIVNASEQIAAAAAVSKTLGHDPFKGHGPNDGTGKSRFDTTGNNEYVGDYDGPCNADEGMPAKVKAELVETVRDDDSVKLFVYRLVPTTVVVEGIGGRGFLRQATDEEITKGVDCGVTTRTRMPKDGNLLVSSVHGCLQLEYTGDENLVDEEDTTEFTVCLTKENEGWALASVYPGRPGGDIGTFLSNAVHYCGDFDKDDGVAPVRGYHEGDCFWPDLLVEPPPSWIYDHIVIRRHAD